MKGYKKIEEILHSEFDDYSYFDNWEIHLDEEDGDVEHYHVDIKRSDDKEDILYFKTSDNGEVVEIDMSEDSWQKIETFDWTIKYFWMALLKWD